MLSLVERSQKVETGSDLVTRRATPDPLGFPFVTILSQQQQQLLLATYL
jgi:hypothetical protein